MRCASGSSMRTFTRRTGWRARSPATPTWRRMRRSARSSSAANGSTRRVRARTSRSSSTARPSIRRAAARWAIAGPSRRRRAALASGATHLFDEKYGDEVRVVEAGPTSRELCGGTHCHCTGDIGLFLITKEESIGAGVRRIEAVTGEGALREVHDMRDRVERAAGSLKVPPARLPEAVAQMAESREKLEKQLAALQKSGVDQTAHGLVAAAELLDGAKLVVKDVGDYDQQVLRGLADRVRDGLGTGIAVLGSTHAGRPGLAVAVSNDLTARVHAGNLVKELASIIDGSGGGPANSATGGGKDAARLGDALEAGARAVREKLGGRG